LFLALEVFGYPYYLQDFNRSHEKWMQAETMHFRFYYIKELDNIAYKIANISESIYDSVRIDYDHDLPKKVDFIILDEDFSNGYAIYMLNSMAIWVFDADFDLRGTHNWFRNVITHEFAHIVTLQKGSKTKYNWPDIRFGFFDYFNEHPALQLFTSIPMENFPFWFAEGIAQYESKTYGSDKWDSHRDMILRMAVLDSGLLSYDVMCTPVGKGINYEKAYNSGFSLVNYIHDKYGKDKLKLIVTNAAKFKNITFDMAIKDALGISASQLYGNWLKHMKHLYSKQITSLGNIIEGNKITKYGFSNTHPCWAPDNKSIFFLSNDKGDYGRQKLYSYSLSDTIKEEEKRLKPEDPFISGNFSVSKDSIMVFSGLSQDKHGYSIFDIYKTNMKQKLKWYQKIISGEKVNNRVINKKYQKLTRFYHASSPAISTSDDHVAFIKRIKTKNYLVITDTLYGCFSKPGIQRLIPYFTGRFSREIKSYENPDKKFRILFPSEKSDSAVVIYDPEFSPDGKHILFSFFDGFNRDIGMVDLDGSFTPLLTSGSDERDPSWYPDGKSIIFASDRTGIFNLYKFDIETEEIIQLTNVRGGAFMPNISGDSKSIAYSNYNKAGYQIYVISLDSIMNPPVTISGKEKTGNIQKDIELDFDYTLSNKKSYKPLPNQWLFSPLLIGEEMSNRLNDVSKGRTTWKLGMAASLMDVLWKTNIFLYGLAEIKPSRNMMGIPYARHGFMNPKYDKEFGIGVENKSLPLTVTANWDKFLINETYAFLNYHHEDHPDSVVRDTQTHLIDYNSIYLG
ncbi:MAG: hypothetical protein ABIA63_02495, partial [bacterium]